MNEYNKYALGQPTPERYTRAEAKQLAPIYLKQFGESAKIIDKTTNPETFFYRYGFALQRLTELEKMQKLVKFSGNNPSNIKQQMIDGKQACIRQLIDRMKDKLDHKLFSLKTEKAIANNIIKFNTELEQYHSEMDLHTLSYKNTVINSLKDKYNINVQLPDSYSLEKLNEQLRQPSNQPSNQITPQQYQKQFQGRYFQSPNQFPPQPPKRDNLKIIKICAIGLFVSLVFLANRWIFAISIFSFIAFSIVLVINLSKYTKESNFAKTGKASGAKLTGCGTIFFLLLFFTIALAISAPNTEKSVTPEVSPEPNESISTEIVSEIETDTSIVSSAKESSIVESTAESRKEKSSTSKRQEEVSKKESSKAESDITFKEEMTSQNNSSSKTSSKDNTDILSSEPIEMNSLQYLFASLNSSMRREDVNAYITNNGLMKYAFSWDSAYQIGYDYKAITERGRDREGEAVDISFDSDGMVESAKLVYHTGFNTKYRFKFENGDFWDEGLKLKNGEEAVKRYLYSRKIETSNDSKNVSKEESKIESRIEFKSESKAESKTETKDKSEKNSKFEGSSRAEFIASSKAESKSESKVQSVAPQPQLSAYEFYGNMDSMCYHTKNCQAAQKITDEHRFTYTVNAYSLYDAEQAARQYFESQGYQLCGICARQ